MKRFLAATTAALMVALVASVAIAAPTPTTDLTGQSWRVYNRVFTPSLWDINKVKLNADGDLAFPIQQFDTASTGSFAVYLLNNYNVDLTGKTLAAVMTWTAGDYATRDGNTGAFVRFEFQDVTAGPFTSNDYWWYAASVNLEIGDSGTLTASLDDRANWTNICGQRATDTTAHPGPNCVGGTDPAVSPYNGFTNAMTDVKQLGLSFGNDSAYARGIARVGGAGTFTVSSFEVTP